MQGTQCFRIMHFVLSRFVPDLNIHRPRKRFTRRKYARPPSAESQRIHRRRRRFHRHADLLRSRPFRPSSIANPQPQIWSCHRINRDADSQTGGEAAPARTSFPPRSDGPAKSLSPMPESAASATLKSAVPPSASVATGHATESPLLPSRLPPDPSSRSERIESGRTMRSPSSAANSGCAAHDHGTALVAVVRQRDS